jgi:hypothetical protein
VNPRSTRRGSAGPTNGRESAAAKSWAAEDSACSSALHRSLALIVIIVAESFRDKPDGTAGAYRLIQQVKAAMRSKAWKTSQADRPFVFERWQFLIRRGPRVAYQIEFRATALEDFQLAA